MALREFGQEPQRILAPAAEGYQRFKTFLDTYSEDTTQEVTINDLRRVLKDTDDRDLLKEFLDISRKQGRNIFAVTECLELLRAKEFLRAKPLLTRVIKLCTILVVAKNKRRSTMLEKVSSLTNCSDEIHDDPMVILKSYSSECIRQAPIFIISISAVQVALFAYYCVYPSCALSRDVCQLPCNSSLIFSPYKRRELWRYLSYAMIHDGFLHLGSNVILQIAFGLPLEVIHSWWRVMIVYFCGVQCGPLAQSLFNPHVYLAGCSSGLYALQTAHLAHIIANFKDMEYAWIRLTALFLIYGNDVYWVLSGPQLRQGRSFSYAGHYGGALAGLLVGVPALKTIPLGKWARYLEHGMLCVFCAAVWSVMFWNVVGSSYLETTKDGYN